MFCPRSYLLATLWLQNCRVRSTISPASRGLLKPNPSSYFTIHGKYLGSESAQLCTSLNTERLETLHDQVLKTSRDIPTPSHDCIFVSLRQSMTIQHEVVKLCQSPVASPPCLHRNFGRFPETGTSSTRNSLLTRSKRFGPWVSVSSLSAILKAPTTTCFTAECAVQQVERRALCASPRTFTSSTTPSRFIEVQRSTSWHQAVLIDFPVKMQTVDLEVNFWKDD